MRCSVISISGWLIAGLLLWGTAAPAADPEAATSRDYQALTAAVNRLAAALEKQGEQKDAPSLEKLDLAIAYLNFRSRRIEQLERDLASARSVRTNIEGSLKIVVERLRDIDERKRKNGAGMLSDDDTRDAELLRSQHSYMKERISRLDDEIIQQENRIYDLQKEIGSVEEYVRRHLEF